MDTKKLDKSGIQYKIIKGCYILYGKGSLETVIGVACDAAERGEMVTTNSGKIQQILQKDNGSASNVACAVIPKEQQH